VSEVALYRMVLPDHVCPFGIRAKELLEAGGVAFDDRILASREEVDTFKAEQGVRTTPQLFVDGKRLGGAREIEHWLTEHPAA
jgi:glutaredoxin 3